MAEKEPINSKRRRLLKLGVLAGSFLAVGGYMRFGGEVQRAPEDLWSDDPSVFAPGAWLRVGQDDTVTVRVNHSEMGQGITTAFAMIVAEELEADWSRIRVELAPAAEIYKNPAFKAQFTGGSTSIRTSFEILRQAGASAREMLIAAAAGDWQVAALQCRAENGWVIHAQSGRRLRFGQLVNAAARQPVPELVQLKPTGRFKIIGHGLRRLDLVEKVSGKAIFGIDVRVEGLKQATVIHPPVFGARIKRIHSDRALRSPGVHRVLEIESGVAVVADTFWQAKCGADLLDVEWEAGSLGGLSSDGIRAGWLDLAREEGKIIIDRGEKESARTGAAKTISALYELPYQAHATPEPMNCTASVAGGRCEIWAPTQNQDGAQEVAARITGLGYDRIRVHTTYLGGGFGRRVEVDYVAEAVQISKAIGAPVKVVWTREEDMQNDFYRPATLNLIAAGLDSSGRPRTWAHKIIGSDHMAQRLPGIIPIALPYSVPRGARNLVGGIARMIIPWTVRGKKAVEGADLPYAIDAVRVSFVDSDPGIPTGFWRSVAHSQNVFVVESFMDEIAWAAGIDPAALRRELLSKDHRLRNVLDLATHKAGWGGRLPDERHQGLALTDFHGTRLCFVAEVSVSPGKAVRVHRMVCGVDCGIVVNPKIVQAQMESGIAFGLTAALKGEITFSNGRVEQRNFDSFPILRFDEMPRVEVALVNSPEPPSGIGESAVPLIAPAVANAVFAATGTRLRKLPLEAAKL